MEQLTAFKSANNKNTSHNKKSFKKFIAQSKDFNADIWGVITEFMIESRYAKSYRMQINRELRYCESCVDPTTFMTGTRYRNLIQVKMTRNDENEIIENPQFKYYKIKTMELLDDRDDIILLEHIDIVAWWAKCTFDGRVISIDYMIAADMFANKIWTEDDTKQYDIRMNRMRNPHIIS